MSLRLAGVNDLIASEGKYHLGCLKAFDRSIEKTKKECEKADLAFVWLCKELENAAKKGLVFKLADVWKRYVEIAEDLSITVPQSFCSRRATFKEKLVSQLDGEFQFYYPLNADPSMRQTLLIPTKYQSHAVSRVAQENEYYTEIFNIPTYQPEEEDIFRSLVHVALKIRGDMLAKPGHKGLSVSEQAETECIPESLYMFLNILYGGQDVIGEHFDDTNVECCTQRLVISNAQDLIYGVSKGKKWTPKHIGLTSSLHQATRSKDLVNVFHRAGHCLSYKQLLKIDTALASYTLQSMNPATGAVIPEHFVPDEFIHFTADNIDILDESLDGKNTFHATQLAAYQRSTGEEPNILENVEISSKTTLEVPEILERLFPVKIIEEGTDPVFHQPVDASWFKVKSSNLECEKQATACDHAFILHRQNMEVKPSWTSFNQQNSATDHNRTSIGHMPIILAPAHEFNTLNTVVKRCMSISDHFGQYYTVITVDQALYCKLMELKWNVPDYKIKLIPRLGGFHISKNFLQIIGKHMAGCGLYEAWIESGIVGQGAAERVLSGKGYKKAMCVHKQTSQALWRILIPKFFIKLAQTNDDLHNSICSSQGDCDNITGLIAMIKGDMYKRVFSEFIDKECEKNVNFQFWWQYMEMVSTLLMFTRAQREGNWDLHLTSFIRMVPFFHRYDHYNYSRWGSIYIAEMKQLPNEIKEEFAKGNFVVKCSAKNFNQVDPDHAQEWLNGTGKRSGGIIGITKTISALLRWSLSFNFRSHLSAKTHEMYGLLSDNTISVESTPARLKRDNADENALRTIFERFHVFAEDNPTDTLQNIATKDLANHEIQESLLHATELGQKQMLSFVTDRLIHSDTEQTISFNAPIKKCQALNFENLYEVPRNTNDKEKKTVLKVDRNVLLRLITAYDGGREVDLKSVLSHELMPVPLSLAEMNGSLRTGNKSVLVDKLTDGIDCPESIDIQGKTACLIVDGQALVVSLGKPNNCSSFGDFAGTFVQTVLQMGKEYQRIDIVFDRYRKHSIKGNTRQRRTKTNRPIRRVIESGDVPLPKSWPNFLALQENKTDLARFLSEELIRQAPINKEIVTAGGFINELDVKSSKEYSDTVSLKADHEEADTRLVLHAINARYDTVVVAARDTDVLVILVSHYQRMLCNDLWMMAGTSKKRKYIPVKDIFHLLPEGSVKALIPFHTITGCDTTSYLSGHTKSSAWKVFRESHQLLINLGETNINEHVIQEAEKFLCHVYGVGHVNTTDEARHVLFFKKGKPEALPPISDAARHHILRSHFQSMVWKLAVFPLQDLPSPTCFGWELFEDRLKPVLMTSEAIPTTSLEMIYCGCSKQCTNNRCRCRKAKLPCTVLCRCKSATGDDMHE